MKKIVVKHQQTLQYVVAILVWCPSTKYKVLPAMPKLTTRQIESIIGLQSRPSGISRSSSDTDRLLFLNTIRKIIALITISNNTFNFTKCDGQFRTTFEINGTARKKQL